MTTAFVVSGLRQVLLALAIVLTTAQAASAAATSASLVRNTFLGGSADDLAHAIAVDNSGNTYVAGNSTAAWGSPVRPYGGLSSAFVAKLDAEGTLLWNTFLGGSALSASTVVNDITVDANGNVYVSGESNGTWGSPVRAFATGTLRDAFAAKIDASGTLVWNTFLGSSGDEGGRGIAVDTAGYVYVAGTSPRTWGIPVRAYTASNDAFVVRLGPDGMLLWNTFLGGAGAETGLSLAIDGDGNAYVTGVSNANWGSPVIPYTSFADAFVAKVGTNGALVWNTFAGGPVSRDIANSITVGGDSVYVTGSSSEAWGNPVRAFTPRPIAGQLGSFGDAFVVKLRTDGVFVWSTFLGGAADDTADGIAFDASGNVYVSGSSMATWGSPTMPYVGGPGSLDAFAARLDNNGSLLWNGFLGCSTLDVGSAIAVDSIGNVHLSGYSGNSWGSPIRQYTVGSVRDAFVATLGSAGDDDPPLLTLPDVLTVEATLEGGAIVEWTASATDAVDGEVPVQCNPGGGSHFELGVTVVNCSAVDAAGNTATGSFQVMVVDSTAPVITSITATPNVLGAPNHKMVAVVISVSATDGSDPNPSARIVRVTSNEPENGTGDGDTSPDWVITGPLTLKLRAERAGKSQDRVYTITVEVKDQFDNASTADVKVSVRR